VRPGSTTVAEWDAGSELEDFTIETAEYGMDVESEDLHVDDIAADSAEITMDVLSGERRDQFRDAILVNAALRMYAAGDVAAIEDGIEEAEHVVDNGRAESVLADVCSF
jgi:anthranilate phosphoribosyltransferase